MKHLITSSNADEGGVVHPQTAYSGVTFNSTNENLYVTNPNNDTVISSQSNSLARPYFYLSGQNQSYIVFDPPDKVMCMCE